MRYFNSDDWGNPGPVEPIGPVEPDGPVFPNDILMLY